MILEEITLIKIIIQNYCYYHVYFQQNQILNEVLFIQLSHVLKIKEDK